MAWMHITTKRGTPLLGIALHGLHGWEGARYKVRKASVRCMGEEGESIVLIVQWRKNTSNTQHLPHVHRFKHGNAYFTHMAR
jgi:hypothetical protein